MKIAIPVTGGKLAPHFGHCERIALIEADVATGSVSHYEEVDAPAHEHGVLPAFVIQHGANLVIAGGLGAGARSRLEKASVQVIAGAPEAEPIELVREYLAGKLEDGKNACCH